MEKQKPWELFFLSESAEELNVHIWNTNLPLICQSSSCRTDAYAFLISEQATHFVRIYENVNAHICVFTNKLSPVVFTNAR